VGLDAHNPLQKLALGILSLMDIYKLSQFPMRDINVFGTIFRNLPKETFILIRDNEDAIYNRSIFYFYELKSGDRITGLPVKDEVCVVVPYANS
jgi:hypothetical protein